MKLPSVGLDNLPNVYIDNITLVNTSARENSGARTEIEVSLHDSVDKHWSSDPLLLKFMKVIIVQSTSAMFSVEVSSGNLVLDPKIMSRNENYTANTVQYKIIDIKSKLQPEVSEDPSGNKILVYNFKTNFSLNQRPSHLNYYVATYIDIQRVMGSYNIAMSGKNTKPLVGPVTSESVLKSGKVVQQTNMFLLPSGEVWTGPVHRHSDQGYMAGSKHLLRSHSTLERIEVKNTKIKELTKKNYKNKKLLNMDNFKASFSNLFMSRKKDGSNRGLFMIDMESFIVKRTKHGKSLLNLDRDLFDSYLRSVRISKIIIERFVVRKGNLNKKKKKEIALSLDDKSGRLIGKLLMNKRGESLQVNLKDILINKKEMKNGDSVEDFLYDGAIKELYLFNSNIRSFEFADYSAARGGNNDVVYSVSIKMIDQSTPFVKNILKQMVAEYNKYENYLESAGSIRNYNFKMNRLKERFVKEQNDKFALDAEFNRLKQAPWIAAADQYVKYMAMLKNMSEQERIELKENIYGMINPTDFKIKNGRKFSRDFRILISKYIEFFDVKGITLAKTSSKSSTKSSKENKTIEQHHLFTELYPIKEPRMYDFLGLRRKTAGLLRVDRNMFDNRLSEETSNYTGGGYSPSLEESNNLGSTASRALADISGNQSSFLTPVKLIGSKTAKDITFRKIKKEEGEEVNKFMNMKSPPMAVRTKILSKGKTTPNPDESEDGQKKKEEEKFYDASENLGSSSSFTKFSGSIVPTILPTSLVSPTEHKAVKSSVLNRFNFTKMKTTTSFDLTSGQNRITPMINKKSKKESAAKLKNIPTQVKSLFFRKSDSSSNALLNEDHDVLENPQTANLAELSFMTIQKIEFLEGFMSDQQGRIQINKPIWTLLTAENYQTALDNVSLCRMSYYEDESLDISIDDAKKLPIVNQYFVLSNELKDANQRRQAGNDPSPTTSVLADMYLEEHKHDVKYATSNVVKQPNNNSGIITNTPTMTQSPAAAVTQPMGGPIY